MMLAAARALAATVGAEERNANYIIPSVFHADVAKTVAAAVREAAIAAGTAQVTSASPGETGSFPVVSD
jgi:malate dehydrogenase (oxaloacetate-decarboxylating)